MAFRGGGAATRPNQSLMFLLDARDAVEALRDGIGWEIEYPRDVWRLDKLPGVAAPAGPLGPRARLRFERITQLWLRDLGKRWTRLRLTSALSIGAARAGVDALIRFSDFLTLTGVDTLADVDRPLLERYLAHVMSQPGGHGVKKTRFRYTAGMIWSVSTLLRRRGTAWPVCRVNFSMDPPYRSAGLARWPVTAVAAATSGDTRWVRPPRPCRPSKFRLEVEALRSPGAS